LTIYDDYDNILIKRTGLSPAQLKKIEFVLSAGNRCVDGQQEPFKFL